MPIRTTSDILLFSISITAFASFMANLMDWFILPDYVYNEVMYSGPIAAAVIGAPVTVLIGRWMRRLTLLQDGLQNRLAHDELTGMRSRRELISDASDINQKSGCVAMLDIDEFKDINDEFGHEVGDEVLRAVSRSLDACLRAGDTLYRVGGEEFLVFFPGLVPGRAQEVVDRMRAAVAAQTRVGTGADSRRVTISAGWAQKKADEPHEAAQRAADLALYVAKDSGRNRTCGAADDEVIQACADAAVPEQDTKVSRLPRAKAS